MSNKKLNKLDDFELNNKYTNENNGRKTKKFARFAHCNIYF